MDAFSGTMRRLHERGPESRGLSIDAEGMRLGPECTLVRRTPDGYRCADREEISRTLNLVYGTDQDVAAVFAGACRITKALAGGEIAFAQIAGLHLPLPELDDAALRRASRAAALIKANFDPAQPRIPAGSPDGGEWTGGGDASGLQAHLLDAGYNIGPEMWRIARDVYRLFMSSGGDIAALRDYLADRGLQIRELPDVIRSLFDPPKPLNELRTTKPPMGFATEADLRAYLGPAPPGYEWHHLIEQKGQFRPDLTSPEGIRTWIQHTDNMVPVPVIKHYCISGIMSRTREGIRFRDVVKAHSPQAQRAFGRALLSVCKVAP